MMAEGRIVMAAIVGVKGQSACATRCAVSLAC